MPSRCLFSHKPPQQCALTHKDIHRQTHIDVNIKYLKTSGFLGETSAYSSFHVCYKPVQSDKKTETDRGREREREREKNVKE